MTKNNLSKLKFQEFLERNRQFKKAKGNRQIFIINNEQWCFSISTKTPQCRQFYEDCVGFVALMEENNKYFATRVETPEIYPWSRTTKNGIRAFSVQVNREDLRRFECR